MQSLKDFWAFCKTIPVMPPGTTFAPPRPDLIMADLKKAAGQLSEDGFNNESVHGIMGTAALAAYLILPILMLTGIIG